MKQNNQDDIQVWFVGAGPGDPELITVKGKKLIEKAGFILYAGSLVPIELLKYAKKDTEVVDSAYLHLEETHALMANAVAEGKLVVRLHTGDPSIYCAIREQMILLDSQNIKYAVVPGVTAAFAAAAAANIAFTVPEVAQSFTITRLSGRTPVPVEQSVEALAKHGGSMAVYLSAADAAKLAQELRNANTPEETTIIAAYQVGWPEEKIFWSSLKDIEALVKKENLTRQTVFLILPGEQAGCEHRKSKLYDKHFKHGYRESNDPKYR